MSKKPIICFKVLFLLTVISYVPGQLGFAQDLSFEMEASPVLDNAQVLNLVNLGIDESGSGPVLISGYLENLSDQQIDDLYFQINVRSSKSGAILELTQISNRPFSLDPYQSVYITNNDFSRGQIPGIESRIDFSGGLTPEGENMINNLEGSPTLPQDVYTVEIIVFQVTNANGRDELASSVVEVGNESGFDGKEIYLKTPGDVIGTEAEITNPYPQFSWDGQTDIQYRLIVVESNGQDSPESLIQSASSSSATNEGGSLLQFENLDVMVDGTNYQFPSSGVQSLRAGNTYYWRVSSTIQQSVDTEQIHSEIWEFKLSGSAVSGQDIPHSEGLEEAIIALIGEEEYRSLQESGFSLQEIEYEGQQFTGEQAAVKLEELLQKIQEEELIIGH